MLGINKFDDLVKSHEFNYRWLSPSIHKYDNVFIQTSAELSRGPQGLVLSKQLQ